MSNHPRGWVAERTYFRGKCRRELAREGQWRRAPTLPPPMPMPQLLSFSSCRVKQAELFSRASKPRTPSGPNALSLRSSSTSWAPAVMSPSPREIWAQRELTSV